MKDENQFDWVPFYKELAEKLLPYKNNRQALLPKIQPIFEGTGINMPSLESDNQLVDIDPFTIYGFFNKHLKKDNCKNIISNIAKIFHVSVPIPTASAGIPVVNNQNAVFYPKLPKRDENDIPNLWGLFETALAYAKNRTAENRMKVSHYFDLSINIPGNGNSKITMGLYWIAPDVFLNLDHCNIDYIYKHGNLSQDFIKTLPEVNDKKDKKMSASTYFAITDKLYTYLQSKDSPFENFMELSHAAWIDSGRRNNEQQTQSQDADDKIKESNQKTYGKANFLQDVYMDEKKYDTLVALLQRKKNVILQGAPGVGKTYAAKRLAYSIMGVKDSSRIMMVQFHQSYSYEDFIMGFRPTANGGYELKHGAFYDFCKSAENASEDTPYFFIIDEINRGNLSKIFGELFMLIEPDKRDMKLKLLYSDEMFSVPKNVYIIGMMNTADRSLAMIDYALRRRFAFFTMEPAFDTEGFCKYQEKLQSEKFNHLIDCIKMLNREIAEDDSLGEGFCIGHSYFCNLEEISEQTLSSIVEYELIPLLQEYWFDEPAKVRTWSENLRSAMA